MIVYCYNDECKYYQDDMCCREAIDINEDGICDDFENFRNAPEYKQKYWIAKSSLKTHKPYKCLRYGKKITINNVDFYTEDNTLLPETTNPFNSCPYRMFGWNDGFCKGKFCEIYGGARTSAQCHRFAEGRRRGGHMTIIRKIIAYPIFWVGLVLTGIGTLVVGLAEGILLQGE